MDSLVLIDALLLLAFLTSLAYAIAPRGIAP